MGNPSRRKGDRAEREIVNLHRQAGIPAERVPLSGACGGSFSGDVIVGHEPRFKAECKARKGGQGFAMLERWLAGNQLLFLRRDRARPMVCMDWDTYMKLIQAAQTK